MCKWQPLSGGAEENGHCSLLAPAGIRIDLAQAVAVLVGFPQTFWTEITGSMIKLITPELPYSAGKVTKATRAGHLPIKHIFF